MNVPSPRPRRRRLRRIAGITLLVLVVLPVVLVLGVLAALRASGVRQAILGRVSELAAESGLELKAEDFSPVWRRSGIELRNVRLGAPGKAPLVTAPRVRAEVALGSLRERPLVLRLLEVEGGVVDLSAPFPKVPESADTAGAGPPVEIQRIVIRNARVRGAALAKPAADWVRSWRAEGIAARGSYRGGRLDLRVERAEAVLDRPGFGEQRLQVAGRVGYEADRPVRIEDLRVSGDGIRLTASGSVALVEGGPVSVVFDVDAEPRALLAGVPPRGRIQARGRIALPEKAGRVVIAAEEIPAEAFRPYLDAKLWADLSLAGTSADLQADAALGPGDWTRAAGRAELAWRRGGRGLAHAEARLSPGGPPIVATVKAELLPGSPGRRTIEGKIRAASWTELARATAEGVRAEVVVPDVRLALVEIRSIWPRLVPAPPAGTPLQGSLNARADLSGTLVAPDAVVDATWLPRAGSRVRVEAKGKPLAWSGSATVDAEAVPLEMFQAFAPGLAGNVTGTVALAGTPRGYRTRVETAATGLAYPPALEGLESGTARADGTLVIRPLSYRGTLSLDGMGLTARPNASDTARVARFRLDGDGRLQASPLRWEGTLSLDGEGIDLPGTARVDRLQVAAQGTATADMKQLAAKGRVDADRVVLAESGTEIRNLHAEAEGDGREVRVAALSAELPEGRSVQGNGRIVLDPLLAEADLDLKLAKPLDAVSAAELTARLRNGLLEIEAPRVETAGGPGSLRARVPLGALRRVPRIAEILKSFPGPLAEGPVTASLEMPALDSAPLLAALGLEPRPERLRAGVTADVTLDPAAPAAGRGEVRLSGLSVETPDGRIDAEGPLVLRLAEGRLELTPVRLRVEAPDLPATAVEIQGNAELARGWRPLEAPASALVTRIEARGSGEIEASILNPYLQGGAGQGAIAFSGRAWGPLKSLQAEARVAGERASLNWTSPALRVESPRATARLAGGRWTIEDGGARVNGGSVDLAGTVSPEGAARLETRLAGVRYRFDYGLEALLSGNVAFQLRPGERSRATGRIVVERGVLDRDVNLDRELFSLLLKPEDTPSTEESALSAIDLDLAVETRGGVRIKNNVGDLRASWQRLDVTGTAENPIIKGRIDIDPGGLLYAYGQTVRIDRGSLLFTGDPLTDPRTDLVTTSSLQDPTITRLRGESPLDILERPADDPASRDTRDVLAAGLTGYYGARILAGLGESLGVGGFSVRPVLVFNEADPSARLTVGRDLSPNVAVAFSLDLRNAERQTYLLYVHELRNAPGLRVEGFTNDVGHQGASLQHSFELGGTREARETGPRLRRLTVSTPKGGVSKRRLRRATGLKRGEPLPEGAEFAVDVELTDFLRRRGYPDPRVEARVTPVASRKGRVDVAVTVEPGPEVKFRFEGDAPPRSLRPEITALYRTDFYEAASIEEMRKMAVRAFRSVGQTEPTVAIEVQRERPEDPDGPRTVVIRSAAGKRRSLETLEIAGLEPEEQALVAAGFPGVLSRAELAARQPGADRRLLERLRALGYPEARILTRYIPKDGSRLVVTVDPGTRQRIANVAVTGVEEPERNRLSGLLELKPGDPARMDRIDQGAAALIEDLRARGFADATVIPSLRTAAGESHLTYEVAPGGRYTLAGVGFEGERWTSPGLLRRVADLDAGAPLEEEKLILARNRLFQTGAFSRVEPRVEKDEDGEARVTFALAEPPRFRVGYGARWESSVGTAAVLDFVDRNFLGRAMTLGLRGLYQQDDRSGRLYLRTGGLLGTKISLESYAEVRRRFLDDQTFEGAVLIEDLEEAALQLARPFGTTDTARLYARYRTTRLRAQDPDPDFPFELLIRLPYVGLDLLRDTRDDRLDPHRGLFASMDLSGSGSFLGSDFKYARLFAQGSYFRGVSVAGRRFTWAQSLRLGLAHPFSGQTMARVERFFAGGPFSVRGYEFESLGPQESLGDTVQAAGGEALLAINQELRFPLPWDLTGLAFFDAGQVWARPGDADFDLAKSLGLGLRARTPVGLLRFDAAFPLDRREGDRRYKLYFGLGNAF
ncbi:MAG: translocation/assembly module TamB domain-containing protein [Thermoanaerobaculia bacterium]